MKKETEVDKLKREAREVKDRTVEALKPLAKILDDHKGDGKEAVRSSLSFLHDGLGSLRKVVKKAIKQLESEDDKTAKKPAKKRN